MTDHEILSQQYSDLKVKYWELQHSLNNRGWKLQYEIEKDKRQKKGVENEQLKEEIIRLKKEIVRLKELYSAQQVPDSTEEDEIRVFPKNAVLGNYVRLQRYEKAQKMASEYARKYGECEKINIRLREEINQLKEQHK